MEIQQVRGLRTALGNKWIPLIPSVSVDYAYTGTGLIPLNVNQNNGSGLVQYSYGGSFGTPSFSGTSVQVSAPAQDATNPYNLLIAYNIYLNNVVVRYSVAAPVPDAVSLANGDIEIARIVIPSIGQSITIPVVTDEKSTIRLSAKFWYNTINDAFVTDGYLFNLDANGDTVLDMYVIADEPDINKTFVHRSFCVFILDPLAQMTNPTLQIELTRNGVTSVASVSKVCAAGANYFTLTKTVRNLDRLRVKVLAGTGTILGSQINGKIEAKIIEA